MWNWIKRLFGWKPLCPKEEKVKLLECIHCDDKKSLKKQINVFCKAIKK